MGRLLIDLKSKKAYSLYLSAFTVLYVLFSFLELRKSQYISTNSLKDVIDADQYQYLLGVSKIMTSIEYMITALFFACLLIAILHKKSGIATFIKVHYSLILLLFLLGSLLSISYAAPLGNITQALVLPFTVTSLVLLFYTAQSIRNRFSHENIHR